MSPPAVAKSDRVTHVIEQIEREGYCRIPQAIPREGVQKALELVKHWHAETRDKLAENKPYLAKEDTFVWNLQNKAYFFLDLFFGCRAVQEVLRHFLNDPWYKQIPQDEPNFILRNFLGRSSDSRLPMHIDSLIPYQGKHVFVMQAAFILEDQTLDNGCTVVVPGSHLSGEYVDQSAFDTATPVESRAGDVVIWDSRIWHGAIENTSDRTRWSLIATCTRWWLKQGFNIPRSVPQDIYERLTPSQKAVLGYCSIPYVDEMQGIDMKRGYDSLAERVQDYQ